ncbi:hypothetical protein [Pantoea septica]|uniref:hypothetical protein n=1 Tax=Pantoea septica TaxID=472695 RepID=UPI00068476EA|nr:hypothetical protein [Pantoea septica]
MIKGDSVAITRLLESGAVLNANNTVHRFGISDKTQQAQLQLSENYFRQRNYGRAIAGAAERSDEPENKEMRTCI